MTYPKFRNKWLGESLVSPIETSSLKKLKAKGVIPKNLPKRYIISYQNDELKYFKKKYGREFRKFESLRSEVLFCKDFGFVSVNGIGSPHAAMVLEQLIALGGREFISIGVAGGLKGWGIFLCDKAVRDEGTSYHYIPHGEFVHPDAKLTEKLGRCLAKMGIN